MLCGFDILLLLLTAKQASFASAAPNYEESAGENEEKRNGGVETGSGSEASDGDVEDEEPLPDEEEDLTDGETDVSSEVQKRGLADLLSNLDERDISRTAK